MRLKNLSKLSLEKVRELVGTQAKWRDEIHTITKVKNDINPFGDVVGYKIYTDLNLLYFWYPSTSLFGVDELELPQEYLDDIKQAAEQEAILKADNEERLSALRGIPIKQRIQEHFNESHDSEFYLLHLNMHFSFHSVRSDIILKIGCDSGTIEIPTRYRDGATIAKLTAEEIAEFYTLYEQFNFFYPEPYVKHVLDGWSLSYVVCEGETNYHTHYACPEREDEAWILAEYMVKLFEKYLPPEDREATMEVFRRYSRE